MKSRSAQLGTPLLALTKHPEELSESIRLRMALDVLEQLSHAGAPLRRSGAEPLTLAHVEIVPGGRTRVASVDRHDGVAEVVWEIVAGRASDGEFPPLRYVLDEITTDVAEVLEKALDSGYESVAEIREALEQAADGRISSRMEVLRTLAPEAKSSGAPSSPEPVAAVPASAVAPAADPVPAAAPLPPDVITPLPPAPLTRARAVPAPTNARKSTLDLGSREGTTSTPPTAAPSTVSESTVSESTPAEPTPSERRLDPRATLAGAGPTLIPIRPTLEPAPPPAESAAPAESQPPEPEPPADARPAERVSDAVVTPRVATQQPVPLVPSEPEAPGLVAAGFTARGTQVLARPVPAPKFGPPPTPPPRAPDRPIRHEPAHESTQAPDSLSELDAKPRATAVALRRPGAAPAPSHQWVVTIVVGSATLLALTFVLLIVLWR